VAVEGQIVTIQECVPHSKLKRWELVTGGEGDA
jgi:small subunit ribosomal protein S17